MSSSQYLSTVSLSLGHSQAKVPLPIFNVKIIIASISLLTAGTMSSISFKYLSSNLGYKHGIIQTMFMFLGEHFNFYLFYGVMMIKPTFYFNKWMKADQQDNSYTNLQNFKLKCSLTKYWMAQTSFCDTVGSSLQIVAFMQMPVSINQMLSGGIIITTCILSKLILGK